MIFLTIFNKLNFPWRIGITLSTLEGLRKDYSQLKEEWFSLDPLTRTLDIATVASIVLFGLGYILISVLKVTITVSNGVMLIFPLILAGYLFVFRSKVADPDEDNKAARREFIMLTGITITLILLTFIYGIIINTII